LLGSAFIPYITCVLKLRKKLGNSGRGVATKSQYLYGLIVILVEQPLKWEFEEVALTKD